MLKAPLFLSSTRSSSDVSIKGVWQNFDYFGVVSFNGKGKASTHWKPPIDIFVHAKLDVIQSNSQNSWVIIYILQNNALIYIVFCVELWCLTPISTIGNQIIRIKPPICRKSQSLSFNVVLSTPCHDRDSNLQL